MHDTCIIDFNAQHSDEKFLEHAKTVLLKKILDFEFSSLCLCAVCFKVKRLEKETKYRK